jgi:5-methyltetrahydropteroyltriglutamate--homocysteine methyltransferase
MPPDRIRSTHTGSLPRPADLVELIMRRDTGKLDDVQQLYDRVLTATAEVVQHQVSLGIDIPSDGESGKASYATYVKERLTGFDGPSRPPFPSTYAAEFPDWQRRDASPVQFPTCNGPVTLKDPGAVRRDVATLQAALATVPPTAAFMSAASPGVIDTFLPSTHHANDRAFLVDVAAAMRDEYQTIVEAGFILQIDCPDLAMSRNMRFADLTDQEFLAVARMHVEVLNDVLAGLPRERIRLHLCWGNFEAPHTQDIPLADILDVVLEASVGGVSFEAANPRHAHEWRVFRHRSLPANLVLIPGVIDSCTNYVEHPELVAERLGRFADLVGLDRVIAGTDCGFGTSAGRLVVAPSVVWAKLRSLVEGARLASDGFR